VSLIIFIKPEINTGDIGDRRDSGQLKNEKKKKTTSAIAIWGYLITQLTWKSFGEGIATPSPSVSRWNFPQKDLRMSTTTKN
jgi:hypothetical protein